MDWHNPKDKAWYGVVKSSLQKHIRRAEPEGAAKMAAELWRLQSAGFGARLPIICVEDALEGAPLLPFMKEDPCGVAAEFAKRPKNKDSTGLCVELGYDVQPIEWFGADATLGKLVDEKNGIEAAKVAWALWNKHGKREVRAVLESRHPAVKILLDRADKDTAFQGEPVNLVYGSTLLASGWAATATDQFEPMGVRKFPQEDRRRAPWYGCDFHTLPGKMALSAYLKQHPGTDEELFKKIWFYAESANMGPTVEHRYWNLEKTCQKRLGMSEAEMRARWAEARTEVIKMVKWACSTQGIEAFE